MFLVQEKERSKKKEAKRKNVTCDIKIFFLGVELEDDFSHMKSFVFPNSESL
jgi:hypothetical protein